MFAPTLHLHLRLHLQVESEPPSLPTHGHLTSPSRPTSPCLLKVQIHILTLVRHIILKLAIMLFSPLSPVLGLNGGVARLQ